CFAIFSACFRAFLAQTEYCSLINVSCSTYIRQKSRQSKHGLLPLKHSCSTLWQELLQADVSSPPGLLSYQHQWQLPPLFSGLWSESLPVLIQNKPYLPYAY